MLMSAAAVYSTAGKGEYCDEHVCLSVCPLTYPKNHASKLHQVFDIHCLPPLLGRLRAALQCTSGFVDDVMVVINGL